MTNTRTDIHRPSSPDFDPEAYALAGAWDMAPEWPNPEATQHRIETVNRLIGEGFRLGAGSSRKCGHCGTRIRYAALMTHAASRTMIYVGETCLDERFSLTAAEFRNLRETARLNRERMAREEKMNALIEQCPALVWASYAHNIDAAGAREVVDELYGPMTDWSMAFGNVTRTGQALGILHDLYAKAKQYGTISDKQAALVEKLVEQVSERYAEYLGRESAKAALVESGVQAPEGRVQVEGEVVSVKWQDNDFGGSLKWTVKTEEGWAVWGTVPSSLHGQGVDKGTRVRFTATLKRSDRDPLFAFATRPTKAEIVDTDSLTD